VFGLKEAPRLWYLAARKRCQEAGFEELHTAKSTFVVRNSDGTPAGMLVLHVDDGCWAGEGPAFAKAQKRLRGLLNMGKEESGDFVALGRHVTQRSDGSIHLHQDEYIKQVTTIYIPKERRSQPESPVTDDERKWFEEHLEKRLEDLERKVGGMVTWQGLGTVALILVALTTLIVTLAGAR
jgi:hypothetical protein